MPARLIRWSPSLMSSLTTESCARVGAFISLPKNASKTVLDVLELGRNRNLERTNSPVIYENHQRGSVLSARYELSGLFVFCFVRDPYARCVSWYEYHRKLYPYNRLTFAQWVEQGLPHHWQKQNLTDYAATGLSPLRQMTFIENCKVDFIGRVESFAPDLRHIIDQLNVACADVGLRRRFQHRDERLNTSGFTGDSASYYDDRSRQRVFDLLRDDFEYLGYPA
jgi:hypothetical protein